MGLFKFEGGSQIWGCEFCICNRLKNALYSESIICQSLLKAWSLQHVILRLTFTMLNSKHYQICLCINCFALSQSWVNIGPLSAKCAINYYKVSTSGQISTLFHDWLNGCSISILFKESTVLHEVNLLSIWHQKRNQIHVNINPIIILQDINMFNPNQIYNLDENEKCNNCFTQFYVNGYQLLHQTVQNMLMLNTHHKQRNRKHSKINGVTTSTKTRIRTTFTTFFV